MLIITREGDRCCNLRPSQRAMVALVHLREHDPEFFLLDGSLAECDRVGDGRTDYSYKHRHHIVNIQVVIDPGAQLRCYDFRLARAAPGHVFGLAADELPFAAFI